MNKSISTSHQGNTHFQEFMLNHPNVPSCTHVINRNNNNHIPQSQSFTLAKGTHQSIMSNVFLFVIYCLHHSGFLSCFSTFHFSDGWTKNDLVYSWYKYGPVQIPGNLSLPGGFKLGGYSHDYCDVITATGEYSCLQVDLTFARQLSFFIVTVYIPCSMTVSVSWLSFWLDHKAVSGVYHDIYPMANRSQTTQC